VVVVVAVMSTGRLLQTMASLVIASCPASAFVHLQTWQKAN